MEGPLALARFLHFASLMSLFGAAAFVAALCPTSVGLAPRLKRWSPWLAGLALASGAAWFWCVARSMAGEVPDAGTLATVALDTAFGKIWIVHMGLVLALLAAAMADARIVTLLSGLAVASLALTGHAAMQGGAAGGLHRANHALHIVLTAGWLGGLPPFLICLQAYRTTPARRDALGGMMAYSRVGHYVVPLVLLTGLLDAAMTTGLPPWERLTFYREALLAKVAIFAAMTATALFNRYVLAPKAARSPRAAQTLAAGAALEIALALGALADVSLFALAAPS